MTAAEFRQKIRPTLPGQPGVYQFIDPKGNTLYVGKAKNLKKRVSSYFTKKKYESARLILLTKKAVDIKYTVVNTEADALLLENSLIKEQQPRYNINLKDDKSYPFICIKNERFPRVMIMRNPEDDGSEYLGPYTSVVKVRSILNTIRTLFPLRTCTLNLSQENIEAGKYKVCLEYHIKNCLGPCEGYQSEEDYNESIRQVRHILKGNFALVSQHLKERMQHYAENFEFERANDIKLKLDILKTYQAKSTIVNPRLTGIDVFSIADDENYAFINYLHVSNGTITETRSFEVKKKNEESSEEMLAFAVNELSGKRAAELTEIIVPFEIELDFEGVELTVPKIGDKKKLLELSYKNAGLAVKEKIARIEQSKVVNRSERILGKLKNDLRMDVIPEHIECFDNSNIQGSDPVSSMVVFKDASPSKRDYRKFAIKTVEGPNDFASMKEVVYRRYKRLLDEEQPLPQLIVIDGGKGQLSAAVESLEELSLRGKITIIGIAKRLEEIYFPDDPIPLYIDKKSESLRLIQQIRDEAHRFAITYHRQKRSKRLTQTELETIEGIGKGTAQKLLNIYKSVKKVKQAPEEELASHIGKAKAAKLLAHFKQA